LSSRRNSRRLLLLALLGWGAFWGCGGISDSADEADTTTLVIEVLEEGTDELLPVPATIVIGGLRAATNPAEGWALISGIPLGEQDPPQQPLTVNAAGYRTVSQVLTLSRYTYTTATIRMAAADPESTGTVSGHVTSSAGGEAVPNAYVGFRNDGGMTAAWAYTDNTGAYTVRGVAWGPWEMTVQALGYVQAIREVTVQPDAIGANPDQDFALLPGTTEVTVVGLVLEAGVETPIPGAEVVLNERPAVVTNGEGQFQLQNVQVGAQTLHVSAEGYENRTTEINVLPGMDTVRVYLPVSSPDPPPKPWTIGGHVSIINRPDNSGALVTAVHRISGALADSYTTEADGMYYLFVTPGDYRLEVNVEGRVTTREVTLLGGGRVLSDINFVVTAP
jgi:hypothetical protein